MNDWTPTRDEPLTIIIHGHAEPAGSKRGFVHPNTGRVVVVDANPNSREWKQRVAKVAAEVSGGYHSRDTALGMELVFYRDRPKSHIRTGKREGEVREFAPMWPATRPDTTKLLRAVEDGLQGVLYHDDAQIVEQHVYKRYGLPIRCEIKIWEIEPQIAGEASRLPLRDQKGNIIAYALVDPDDYPTVSTYRWSMNKGYAIRGTLRGGVAKTMSLHREIMGVLGDKTVVVDHINRNPLDNRRCNLRLLSPKENMQNQSAKKKNGSSLYRGVHFHKGMQKWHAGVKMDGQAYELGFFDDEIEAAIVAENFRKERMPYAEPDPALAAVLETRQLQLVA